MTANIRKSTFWLTGITLCLFGIGCSGERQENRNETIITFPLLKECQQEIVSTLNKFSNSGVSEFNFSIDEFTIPLASHPHFTGIVKLKSESMKKEDLIRFANNPIIMCYPNSSFSLSLQDKDFTRKYYDENEINRKQNVEYLYPVIDGDLLTIYFRDELAITR